MVLLKEFISLAISSACMDAEDIASSDIASSLGMVINMHAVLRKQSDHPNYIIIASCSFHSD